MEIIFFFIGAASIFHSFSIINLRSIFTRRIHFVSIVLMMVQCFVRQTSRNILMQIILPLSCIWRYYRILCLKSSVTGHMCVCELLHGYAYFVALKVSLVSLLDLESVIIFSFSWSRSAKLEFQNICVIVLSCAQFTSSDRFISVEWMVCVCVCAHTLVGSLIHSFCSVFIFVAR